MATKTETPQDKWAGTAYGSLLRERERTFQALVTILPSDGPVEKPVRVAMCPPDQTSTTIVARSRISMKQLASELCMDRSACRKYVLRLGFKPVKMRVSDSGFQAALTLAAAEVVAIKAARRADGYL